MRLAIFLAACSAPAATGTVVTMTASDAVPAYGDTPFPTDAARDGAHLAAIPGLEAIASHNADLVAAHVAALDGFGVRPLVEFFVTGDVDPATLGGMTLRDPDGQPVALDWRFDPARHVIAGSPPDGVVLREGETYTALATTAVTDPAGVPLQRADADLSAPRWQATAAALADDAVAGAAVFTVQHATAPLVTARTRMMSAPAPTLTFDPAVVFRGAQLDAVLGTATRATDGPRAGLERWGNDNPTGIAHDHVGVIGTGNMTVVRFRRDDTGTDLPDDETFAPDGEPVAIDTIPITFVVPAAPAPATGYPVVIYGHGLGASRDQVLSFAEPLTSAGFVVVAIDMFGHGSRYDPTDHVANMSNQLTQFTGTAVMPDGFGDTTGLVTTFDFFEGFTNVSAVRDAIRQSALDQSRVVQLLRGAPDLSALGSPALDTSHLAYIGESFGTVVGTLFAAIEPAIDLYVLDVPGGGILDRILPNSPEIASLAQPLITGVYNPTLPIDRYNPLIALMQAVIDGGDPLTYAPHVLADRFPGIGARSVVCIEVVGDQVLANPGTDALATELGLDVLTPDLAPPPGLVEIASPASANRGDTTAVLVQYSPATHGANWSSETGVLRFLPGFPRAGDVPFPQLPAPITIPNPIYDTLDQVSEILATHQAGVAPVVRSTRAPIADFDGDGVPDAMDPAPYDPSH